LANPGHFFAGFTNPAGADRRDSGPSPAGFTNPAGADRRDSGPSPAGFANPAEEISGRLLLDCRELFTVKMTVARWVQCSETHLIQMSGLEL